MKSELDDHCDEILSDAYESVKDCIEKSDFKRELEDGCDEILNKSYDGIKHKIEKRPNIPENMVHLVKNTKKEIKRNHLLAKIRLMELKRGRTFKSKMNDYFYYIESWPNYAIET